MNAVERIEKAIAKLEALKAASAPGVWAHEERGVGFRHEIRDHFVVGYVVIDNDLRPSDAELILTLHRTIDAQLAILRFGVQRLNAVRVLTGKHAEAHAHELALADAILGGES